MAGGHGEVENAYHFKTVDGQTSTAVVEAVAFVTGLDPLDVEPLGRVVDTTALDRLLESADRATVTFEYEGLSVRVGAGGDIHVESADRWRPAGTDLGRANVLLLDGSDSDVGCSYHLDAVGGSGANVLAVTFSPPDAGPLDAWLPDAGPSSDVAVISVGDVARSSASVKSGVTGRTGPAIETVADPADLAAVEDRIAGKLAAWAGREDRTVVCFDSVTSLRDRVGDARTVEFLRSVTERTRAAAAGAHFHLDAERYGGEFAESVSGLFDAVVTVGADGEWTVEPARRD